MDNFPNKFKKLLDINRINNNTKNIQNLKVELKMTPKKGAGLFAKKLIKKGEIIAYYKLKVFNFKKYDSPTDMKYSFAIYKKNGKESNMLIGDIDEDSIPDPIGNVPFWGIFANEPSGKQKPNSEVDTKNNLNYQNRNKIKIGTNIIYGLIASRNIRPGKEITWYYGEDYERDYKINIDPDDYE